MVANWLHNKDLHHPQKPGPSGRGPADLPVCVNTNDSKVMLFATWPCLPQARWIVYKGESIYKWMKTGGTPMDWKY